MHMPQQTSRHVSYKLFLFFFFGSVLVPPSTLLRSLPPLALARVLLLLACIKVLVRLF